MDKEFYYFCGEKTMNYGRTSLRRRAKQLDARGTRIRHKIGVILSKLLLIGIIVGGCAAVSFGVGAFKESSHPHRIYPKWM